MIDYNKERRKFVELVKKTLSGEKLLFDGNLQSEILVESNPFNRYTTGILYPAGLEEEDEDDDSNKLDDEIEEAVSAVSKSTQRYQPPSSMGFSFYVDSSLEYIRVSYKAVVYESLNSKRTEVDSSLNNKWKKIYLPESGVDDGSGRGIPTNKSSVHYIYEDSARIDINVRSHADGKIITVTLSNMQKEDSEDKESSNQHDFRKKVENSFFEVELVCHFDRDSLRNYPRVKKELLTDEERELELRYKEQHVYAIGHGVAVDWENDVNNDIKIFSDFMPVFEVPQVTANTGNSSNKVLDFEFLSSIQNNEEVFEQLLDFVEGYESWIESQENIKKTEDEEDQVAAQKIINRMHIAAQRMKGSILVLQSDPNAQYAFALANEAMLVQMKQGRPGLTQYGWRPFQLAFVLMVLQSVIDEDDEYRDLVDLIWFPTGGGKTEAYLGVMAFLFVYRRLSFTSSGNGTVAIMRYTLRLLTAQQFVRACKVIGALELIRREEPRLGDQPFTVGLWLGGSSSPNTYKQALEYKDKLNFSKFVLLECPWCSQKFNKDNYYVDEDNFNFLCTNQSCDFGKEKNNILPFNVVDDALYDNPPSLLIATVDKFARLAWKEEANSFFGRGVNRPPELIIQDELHLISGALGSIVGIYEAGLEAIITSKDVYPKFIASTATIRQANEQVKALFGRDMAVFPPVGLRQKDAYFAKEVPLSEKPGRLYVGYLAFNRQKKNSLEDLAGALLATPQILYHEQDELKDAWWTQMVYHGSLKSVGNSQTNFQNNIPKIQKRLLMNYFVTEAEKYEPNYPDQLSEIYNDQGAYEKFTNGKWPKGKKPLTNNDIASLYSQCFPIRNINTKSLKGDNTADTNAQVFDSLSSRFDKDDAIDAVLATNMVSVGLDEPRLALMVMNGQPLTTAEYIQASSRVGRGDIPGIVFVNYYKTQARSLSHYENFRAYHSSFYRFVEPSSLTPFTKQVRNKALHAALVTAIRHGENGLLKNTDAEKFYNAEGDTTYIDKIIKKLKQRVKYSVSGECTDVDFHLDSLIAEWKTEASSAINLRYKSDDKGATSLLVPFDEGRYAGVWQTLNSMRNVEKTAQFQVNLNKIKFNLSEKWFTPVRFSHITGHSGVGSVVYDSAEWLVKVGDTKQWPKSDNLTELHAVERVKTYFKTAKKLFLPPEAQVNTNKEIKVKGDTLPVDRFPSWMSCVHCGLLYYKPWETDNYKSPNIDEVIYCSSQTCEYSKSILKQVVWCAASKNGELIDVPWHYLCHRNSNKKCAQEFGTSYLKIKESKGGRKKVVCTKCGSSEQFEQTKFHNSDNEYEVLEVNDARIYTPYTERALVIPPESNIDRNSIEYQLLANSQLISAIQNAQRPLEKKREILKARKLLKCSKKELLEAIENLNNQEESEFSVTTMLDDEYTALITPADFPEGADFVTRHLTSEWTDYLKQLKVDDEESCLAASLVDRLVAVDRLRVIEVFKGFSRLEDELDEADTSEKLEEGGGQNIIPPDLDGSSDWLPAIELFGEGVFFTLDNDLLKEWESNQYIRLRANEIDQRYQESGLMLQDDIVPTPRFILMHTLAHLLMRELESTAGYPAASLQERIYCSTSNQGMSGIMIYTAVPDIHGTLGGIIQLAEPSKFIRLINNALRQAEWCSLDPVCGEMEKQGPSWLNRAACHACSLVPDTSCSYNNVFLDRVFIKGSETASIPALVDVVRSYNG